MEFISECRYERNGIVLHCVPYSVKTISSPVLLMPVYRELSLVSSPHLPIESLPNGFGGCGVSSVMDVGKMYRYAT